MLGRLQSRKVIDRSYSSIKHLPGSKLIDTSDSLLSEEIANYFTHKTQFDKDLVIVTEKLDGANVGVLRKDDVLYPIMRAGYDVRTSQHRQLRLFADFVEKNSDRFMQLLKDGERACGEWLIKTHSIPYDIKGEPFVIFDIIQGNKRLNYLEIMQRCHQVGFKMPKLIHMGTAIPTEVAMQLLGDGYHGSLEKPEGVVYRYERDGNFYSSAKYVRPDFESGKYMNEEEWNSWSSKKWKVPKGAYL